MLRPLTTDPVPQDDQPGTHLPVFVLTSRLRMIQAITTDSAVLPAALSNKKSGADSQQSLLLMPPTEIDSDQEQNAELEFGRGNTACD